MKNADAPAVKREDKEECVVIFAPFCPNVDTWTPDGESIVEHVAGVEDYQVALATFNSKPRAQRGFSL